MEQAQIKTIRIIVWSENCQEIINIIECRYRDWTLNEAIEAAIPCKRSMGKIQGEFILTDGSVDKIPAEIINHNCNLPMRMCA